jgi:hypothetical protein
MSRSSSSISHTQNAGGESGDFPGLKNLVPDPAAYTGLAGTPLGAVLGFLTGDAAATLLES